MTPNSRRALETSEIVRLRRPDAFARADEGLSRAHWVDGRDLGDLSVLDEIVAAAVPVPRARAVADAWASVAEAVTLRWRGPAAG
ncbi:MAG: hypothetical protein R2726_02615 [Acidimicrobiales bacterium]